MERARFLLQAREPLEKALAMKPESPLLHVNMGMIEEECGDFEAATRHYYQVLASDPDQAEANNNLAMIMIEHPDYQAPETALELARRATKVAPETPAFADTLARAYLLAGDCTNATLEIHRAVDLASRGSEQERQLVAEVARKIEATCSTRL